MDISNRTLIIDLFIFDSAGNLAAVFRDDHDIYLKNVVSHIILTLPIGQHPIKYLKNYLTTKNLTTGQIELLPAIYQNFFDSEPENEYLVFSFKISLTSDPLPTIIGDPENPTIKWLSLTEFDTQPNLLPELKSGDYKKILENKAKYYTGIYQDSDNSNRVLQFEEL